MFNLLAIVCLFLFCTSFSRFVGLPSLSLLWCSSLIFTCTGFCSIGGLPAGKNSFVSSSDTASPTLVLSQPQILCPPVTSVWKLTISNSLLDTLTAFLLIHLWQPWNNIQAEDPLDDGDSGDIPSSLLLSVLCT